jgi:rubrerythrin
MKPAKKRLVTTDHAVQAAIWAETLRAAGIRCEVRNATLSGALGEIPFLDCAPQIWLLDEHDETRAREILQQLKQPPGGPAWRCQQCGEVSEPQFGSCWQCGQPRPG